MARIEKSVFISYRRTDVYIALAVYEKLKNQGYDVFFDYRSIPSGDFEHIIISNIRARAYFLLILTPTALDRSNQPGDWLRREIEIAIEEKRNIVPLFFKGFRFGDPAVAEKLTGKLKNLSQYNGLNVHEDHFDEAMARLLSQYLTVPLNTVLHPIPYEVQKLVKEEQIAADRAIERISVYEEMLKVGYSGHKTINEESKQGEGAPPKKKNSKKTKAKAPLGLSIAFAKYQSKRLSSKFIVQIYLPENRNVAAAYLNSEFNAKDVNEIIDDIETKIGKKVILELASPDIEFSNPVESVIKPYTKFLFLGKPKDDCKDQILPVLLKITDSNTNEVYKSLFFNVRVVDFAFDHISRPFISRGTSIILGCGSLIVFILSLLGQIDTTFGLSSGAAAGFLASLIYARFFMQYQLLRTKIL